MLAVQQLWKTFTTYIKAHNLNSTRLSPRLKSVLYLVLEKENEEDVKKKRKRQVDTDSDCSDHPVQIETVYQEHHPAPSSIDDDQHKTISPTKDPESGKSELDEENNIDDVGSNEPVKVHTSQNEANQSENTQQPSDGTLEQGEVIHSKPVEVKLIKLSEANDYQSPQIGAGQHVQVIDQMLAAGQANQPAAGHTPQLDADQQVQVSPQLGAGQTFQLGADQYVQVTPQLGTGQAPQLGADNYVQVAPQSGDGPAHQLGSGQANQLGPGQYVQVTPQIGGGQTHQLGADQYVQVTPQLGTGQTSQIGAGKAPQLGTDQYVPVAPQLYTGQYIQVSPQLGAYQAPQLGTGQALQLGAGQVSQLGAGQTPQLGAGQAPQLGAGQASQLGADQHVQVGAGQTQVSYQFGAQPGISMPIIVDNALSTRAQNDLSTPKFEGNQKVDHGSTNLDVHVTYTGQQSSATNKNDQVIYTRQQPSATNKYDQVIYTGQQPAATNKDDKFINTGPQSSATNNDDQFMYTGLYKGHQPPDLFLRRLREATILKNHKSSPIDLRIIGSQQIRQLVNELEKQAYSDVQMATANQVLDLSTNANKGCSK